MNNKQFISSLSEKIGIPTSGTNTAVETFCNVITQNLKSLDAVALPTFGRFDAIKEDEKVSRDLSTGKRILLPPVISVAFTPASTFVKSLEKTDL